MTNTSYFALGTIEDFKKGWAILAFLEKVHHWSQDKPPVIEGDNEVRFYESKCGIKALADNRIPAIVPGNFPKCKKCLKRVG